MSTSISRAPGTIASGRNTNKLNTMVDMKYVYDQ